MAFANGWRGPDIVSDGLVLYLDAGSPNSYRTDFGTTWKDMIGNSNGVLTNGASYNSLSGGTMVFDGVDDYVSGSNTVSIGTEISVSTWIRHNVVTNSINRYINVGDEVAVLRHDGVSSVGQLHFYIKTSGILRLALRVNSSLVINNWYHVVGTWNGTTMLLYKNGSNIGNSTPGGTLNGGSLVYTLSSAGEPINGYIAQGMIYNRALTPQEVLQNYNAQKSRFGL